MTQRNKSIKEAFISYFEAEEGKNITISPKLTETTSFKSNKTFDFIKNYSQILTVTFGLSAFFFNLGSNRVLDRKNLVFCGIAIVCIVIIYLIYKERQILFEKKQPV